MFSLQTLRNSRTLVRAAMLWFALSLGVAFASPLMKSVNFVEVCSAAGTLLQVKVADEKNAEKAHTLQCSACLPFAAPATVEMQIDEPMAMPLQVGCNSSSSLLQVQSASPLDARGPPLTC